MKTRPYQQEDSEELDAITRRWLSRWKPDMSGRSLASVADYLNVCRVVGEHDDRVVGYGMARVTAEISGIIDPPTKKDLAREATLAFTNEVLDTLRSRGLSEAHIFVLPQFQGLIRFLARNGWVIDERVHMLHPLRGKNEA